jgi:hypothetical protein
MIGGRAATDEYVLHFLIEEAAQIPGPAAMPFFLEQVRFGRTDGARGEAAWAAFDRDPEAAVEAAVVQWRAATQLTPWEGGARRFAGFLAACNSLDAVSALGDGLRERPVDVRLDVVMALGYAANPKAERRLTDPACLAAAEAVLAGALDDTEEREGIASHIGDEPFSDPRVCDVAAQMLATYFKGEYTFKLSDPWPRRERQRFAVLNAWRAAHGKPPVTPPPRRKVRPVPDATLAPLLERLANAADDEDRTGAAAEVEALGLGALPGVRQALARLPKNARGGTRAALDALTRRLSCRIESVSVEPASVVPGAKLARAIDDLRGKPLTGAAVVGVLINFAQSPPPGTGGMRLSADRGDDGTGVNVRIQFTPGNAAGGPPAAQWYYGQRVRAGREWLLGSDGGTGHDYQTTLAAYSEFVDAVAKAADTPPEVPIEIRYSLRRARE